LRSLHEGINVIQNRIKVGNNNVTDAVVNNENVDIKQNPENESLWSYPSSLNEIAPRQFTNICKKMETFYRPSNTSLQVYMHNIHHITNNYVGYLYNIFNYYDINNDIVIIVNIYQINSIHLLIFI
jgi:hypothetical protein